MWKTLKKPYCTKCQCRNLRKISADLRLSTLPLFSWKSSLIHLQSDQVTMQKQTWHLQHLQRGPETQSVLTTHQNLTFPTNPSRECVKPTVSSQLCRKTLKTSQSQIGMLLSSLRRQNQQKVQKRKSFYTLGWGKWLSNPPRCQQPRRSKMHCLSTIREKMKFPRMHIALETPKGNKIKCGFIDALLSKLEVEKVKLQEILIRCPSSPHVSKTAP